MKLDKTIISKNQSYSNLKSVILLLVFAGLVTSATQGQTKKADVKSNKAAICKIGTTNFECPKGFVKEQDVDNQTILFKSNYNGSITYFFVAISKEKFDDTKVRNVIAGKISGKLTDVFRWNDVKEPMVMNLETKFERKIVNRLGYNNKLVNFVSRYFEFNGKTIVLGYGYDTDSDGLAQLFERGEAIGDNAIGCNAIATTLNSITKEKKGKLQYCSLTALTASE